MAKSINLELRVWYDEARGTSNLRERGLQRPPSATIRTASAIIPTSFASFPARCEKRVRQPRRDPMPKGPTPSV